MSSSAASKSTTPTANASTKQKIIKLKVKPEVLARFVTSNTTIPSTTKSKTSETSSPPADTSTPVPQTKEENVKVEEKKPQPKKPAVKRDASAITSTTAPKPRSRPGPKRRKIETDDSTPWTVTMTGPGAHKLGPKANQGAINANLRALDRKNLNPCRKWGKKTFTLKTFNGSEWTSGSWRAPPKQRVDANGDSNNTPSTNSGEQQQSSNVPSVSSQQPEDTKDTPGAAVSASPAVVSAAA